MPKRCLEQNTEDLNQMNEWKKNTCRSQIQVLFHYALLNTNSFDKRFFKYFKRLNLRLNFWHYFHYKNTHSKKTSNLKVLFQNSLIIKKINFLYLRSTKQMENVIFANLNETWFHIPQYLRSLLVIACSNYFWSQKSIHFTWRQRSHKCE